MGEERYTLQELADASGMSQRNVRAYRTKGLIPAPERVGRRAVYGPEHLDGLLRVREAHELGVPLRMISSLLANGASLPTAATASSLVGSAAQLRRPLPHSVRDLLETQAAASVERLVGLGVFQRDGLELLTCTALAEALELLATRPHDVSAVMDVVVSQTAAVVTALDGSGLTSGLDEDSTRQAFIQLAAAATARAVEYRLDGGP